MPIAQLAQFDAAGEAMKKPGEQDVHVEEVLMLANVPDWQALQAVKERLLAYPRPHCVHADRAVAPPNVPAGQLVHADAVLMFENVPAAQTVQAVIEEVPPNMPRPQERHADRPVVLLNEPGWQELQALATEALLKVPARHATHAVADALP